VTPKRATGAPLSLWGARDEENEKADDSKITKQSGLGSHLYLEFTALQSAWRRSDEFQWEKQLRTAGS
jgi:hypothetical protein